MNTLIIIGWLGTRTAYLNLPIEEAKARWLKANPDCESEVDKPGFIQVETFKDEFGRDDAWVYSL